MSKKDVLHKNKTGIMCAFASTNLNRNIGVFKNAFNA